ncbi:MAG: ABC transporter ATP-binding protein [Sulfolobales archaeon]|nr:ABC transporter ATP-binding protein [Sulfolobales archaeon]
MTAISLKDVRKRFGRHQALKGVSLNVQEGSVTGFVGPNGAGKTTTIKVMAGLVRPDSGEVRLLGRDPFEDVEVMNEVSFVFTRLMYPPNDTVLEYLEDQASVFGGDVKKAIEEFDLKGHLKKRLSELSSGLAQRVQLAAALLKSPKLIIADEPAANLDPPARNELYERIKELNRKGVTFLISSHVLSELERVIDRVVFISDGRVTFEGPLGEALERGEEIYLLVDNVEKALSVLSGRDVRKDGAYLVVRGDMAEAISSLEKAGVRVLIARRSSLDEAFKKYTNLGG